MFITELKAAKKDKNRVHIYSDEKYIGTVYIDYLLEYHIQENHEYDDKIINEAITQSNSKKLFNMSISYVARRARSEKEIRDYLSQKVYKYKWNAEQLNTEEIILKLKKYKYIDDEEFARIWVSNRIKKGMGPQRLKMELIQKGVEKGIIENNLADIQEDTKEEEIKKLTEKFLRKHKFNNDFEKNWKLKQYLRSRGF